MKSGHKWDYDKANNGNRSFHILNCDELKSIEIGSFSYCDYSGEFELNNLPKLESIKIGNIGTDSSNFFCSSFVIKGIIDVYNDLWIDLPHLNSIELGDYTFGSSLSTIISSNLHS